ncbi:hypothetical protein L1049_025384 [Liquidambar formosana]|uniref:BZIP domain-containing protein n=1 Tax=Liquidambar formosana TaxID=63359 RepID=A0AAP0ND22_LIQFO
MIKNRESAARSRARKQAYTNQLEHQVLQLRKTNSRLRKQKEVMMFLSSDPTPGPKYQLRRASSNVDMMCLVLQVIRWIGFVEGTELDPSPWVN